MASFTPNDLLENVHSQSPKSRITASSPPFSAPLPTESPSLSETASLIFGETLPDSWFVTEPLSAFANLQLSEPLASSSPPPLLLSAPASSPLLSTPPSSDAATMSTAVALQFDPLFGMGTRPSYSSWPGIDSNNGLLGQDFTSYGSDISLSPPTGSRSVTASPPHYPVGLAAQQREIKRQHDQARRESKLASRKRAGSNELSDAGILGIDAVASYTTSRHDSHRLNGAVIPGSSRSSVSSISIRTPALGASSPASFIQSPPVSMADLTSAPSAATMSASYVTTSAPQISLLSEPVRTSSSGSLAASYLTAAPYSPPMHGHADQDVFPQSYHEQQYIPDYTTNYAHAAPAQDPSQYPRVMQDQQNMIYHMAQLPPPSHSLVNTGALQQQHQQHQQQHQHAAQYGHYGQQRPAHQQMQHISGQHDTVSSGVRVVQSRPKPQCWDHGCNGRQFSTFSNLLRHQREKSGQAAKAVCPNCGAEFTRTTARNGHLAHDKCKPRRNS